MKTQKTQQTQKTQAPKAGGTVERLKPERVQDGLAVRRQLQRLRVMERLDRLAGWKLTADSRAIGKTRRFDDPQDAAAYAAFAVQLAAGRRLPLGITLSTDQLVVTLRGRVGQGITGTVLDLAADLG
jgi:pterin-4a-carbinolamine dehydratase